jgi:hypothetical protein
MLDATERAGFGFGQGKSFDISSRISASTVVCHNDNRFLLG